MSSSEELEEEEVSEYSSEEEEEEEEEYSNEEEDSEEEEVLKDTSKSISIDQDLASIESMFKEMDYIQKRITFRIETEKNLQNEEEKQQQEQNYFQKTRTIDTQTDWDFEFMKNIEKKVKVFGSGFQDNTFIRQRKAKDFWRASTTNIMREIEKEKEAAKRRSIVSLPENLSNQIHDNSSKILPQTSSIEVIAPVVDLEDLHKENKLQEIGKNLNMPPAKVPLLDSTIKFNSTCVPPIDNQNESIGAGSQEESLPIKAPLVELTHPIEEIPQHFDTKMDLKELEPAVVSPMLQMNSPPKKNRRVSLNSSTDQVKDHWDALEEDEQEDFRIQHRLPQARGRTRRPQTRGRTSSQRRQSRRLEDGSVNERETCAADMDMDTDQDDPLYNSDSNNFSKRYGHPSRRYSVDEEEEDYSYSDEEDEFEDFNQQEKEENSRRKNRRSILSQRESFSNKSSRLLSSLTSLDDSTELKSAQQREQDAIWNLLFN